MNLSIQPFCKVFILQILMFFLTSCQPEFKIDQEDFMKGMVAWSYFNPGSTFTVYLSAAQPAGVDFTHIPITSAIVIVYGDGVPVDTLIEYDSGTYVSPTEKTPIVGSAYSITVGHPDYPNLSTNPEVVPITPELDELETSVELIPSNVAGQVLAIIDMRIMNRSGYGYVGSRVTFPGATRDAFFAVPEGLACQPRVPKVNDIYFFDFSCKEGSELNFRITSSNYKPRDLSEAEVSVCYASAATIALGLQLERFHELNTGVNGVNPFFEPIYLPQNATNGYGFTGSYACKTVTVQF